MLLADQEAAGKIIGTVSFVFFTFALIDVENGLET